MGRTNIRKTTIIMMIFVVLIVGYYAYLSTRNEEANSVAATEEAVVEEMTVVQELLAMSKYKEYPSTPAQVLKYYNEITACFYNEVYSEEELADLVELSKILLDDELLANMTDSQYLQQVKDDIAVFKAGNIIIYDSQVTPSTDVEYYEYNGFECAKLYCLYTLKSGTGYQTSHEVYILRKDENGHWKILGFDLAEE